MVSKLHFGILSNVTNQDWDFARFHRCCLDKFFALTDLWQIQYNRRVAGLRFDKLTALSKVEGLSIAVHDENTRLRVVLRRSRKGN